MNRPAPLKRPFRSMKLAVVALAFFSLTATLPAEPEHRPPAVAQAEVTADALSSGIDLRAVDKSVRPQDDFFHHVNGTWIKDNEIPADKSRYGMFNKLEDETQEYLKTIILEAAEAQAEKGSNQQKLGDMYASFMDEDRFEALGTKPIREELKKLEALANHTEVAEAFGRLMRQGVKAPIGFYVFPDARQPDRYGFWTYQSGLSMPDRDYYLKDDEKFESSRQAFKVYAEKLLNEVGHHDSAAAAERILALETAIAQRHQTRVESRDAEKNYNKRTLVEVQDMLEGFDWTAFAQGVGADGVSEVIVRNLPYHESLGELFAETPLETWKDYLAFRLADRWAPRLNQKLVELHFGFYGTTLNGVPENEPRWKRGVNATSGALGELLGQEYVARHFSPEAKARMEGLVKNLIETYAESIADLDWMSNGTKEKALIKLAKFTPKIGYPDRWRDYSDLEISPVDYHANAIRSNEFELDYQLSRAGQAVDPNDWSMTPQTVNAYYSPTRNEIVFPAAILQPPFFNLSADDAVNYGGIGGVIGHEIGHGFDDQGSKYDGDGNLRNWWTEEDRQAFDALGDRLAAQYDEFSPIEGMTVNGRLTLGENIADLAGVTIGYRAYLRSLEGAEPPVVDGLTGPQRFFMGWAQVWRSMIREDALRSALVAGPHSPAEYRVRGPLRNVDAFYEAFGVQEGDAMYLSPEERVRIW